MRSCRCDEFLASSHGLSAARLEALTGVEGQSSPAVRLYCSELCTQLLHHPDSKQGSWHWKGGWNRVVPDAVAAFTRVILAHSGGGPDPEVWADWALFAERAGLTSFQSKWEVLPLPFVRGRS